MFATHSDESQRHRARQPEERAAQVRAQNAAAHQIARAEQAPDIAEQIRAQDATSHGEAYARLTTEQLEQRSAEQREHRAHERANRPLLDRFESDPAAALAKFRDSSGAMLHQDRAASAGLDLRDYLLQADGMGAVSPEVLHNCIKDYLKKMDATVVIKVCAVCGEQLIGDSFFQPAQPLSGCFAGPRDCVATQFASHSCRAASTHKPVSAPSCCIRW